jgi:hypothetical protein
MTRRKNESAEESIATILEDTEWDYRPKDSGVGLLSPMSRFFRGFPWDGQREDDSKNRVPVFPLGSSDDSGADFSDL